MGELRRGGGVGIDLKGRCNVASFLWPFLDLCGKGRESRVSSWMNTTSRRINAGATLFPLKSPLAEGVDKALGLRHLSAHGFCNNQRKNVKTIQGYPMRERPRPTETNKLSYPKRHPSVGVTCTRPPASVWEVFEGARRKENKSLARRRTRPLLELGGFTSPKKGKLRLIGFIKKYFIPSERMKTLIFFSLKFL